MTERDLLFWLGRDARAAAVAEETRQQLLREVPGGVDLTTPESDE